MDVVVLFRQSLSRQFWQMAVFSFVHLLIGGAFLVLLFRSRCVDSPGEYGLDGCSGYHDPWREGRAPYLLAVSALFIASALGLLRGSRLARITLLSTIVWYFASSFYLELHAFSKDMNLETRMPYGWSYALHVGLTYFVEVLWLWPLLWILFDAWFLFGSPAKWRFRRPPNNSLERTRGR